MAYLDEHARAAIRPIKRRVEDELFARPGVIGVDIGEKVTGGRPTGRAAIVVYVEVKRHSQRYAIPVQYGGVPTDVVQESFQPHRALAWSGGVHGAERHSCLVGGIGFGPCRSVRLVPPDVAVPGDYPVVGTLGALVTPRAALPRLMALTSFHVACVDDAWCVGDPMAHPSVVDGGHPLEDRIGTLARAALSGSVDGAVLLLTTHLDCRAEVVGLGPVRGHARAVVGSAVRKRGRTTGVTEAAVASTDASVVLDFGNDLGVRTLHNQVRLQAGPGGRFGDHGDSGAVLLDDANRVVGLYCAGNPSGSIGFANPIEPVLEQLDVDLLVET
ncbi:S1 family peptidase [Umezawaea tangerina]|uniref:Trypsin-like peptidase n=1 Tax=Umezawaea tangerina TaxID=84725 RepID=A0A2T0TCJ1_9PSEU|nr:S1 family peptidase [Umezawaea tangerina]PRY43375.1 hypothetical protein CLV43_103118 [Umezawaea tangerina]